METNPCTKLIAALGKIRQNTPALCYGEYKELLLQTTHFAYARVLDGKSVITAVNNADYEAYMELQAGDSAEYVGALTGERAAVNGGRIQARVPANSGEIWIPAEMCGESFAPIKTVEIEKVPESQVQVKVEEPKPAPTAETEKADVPKQEKPAVKTESKPVVEPETAESKAETEKVVADWNKPYEEMSVEELQEAILEKMRKNGPVTDYMLGTVRDNTHHGSLVNWVKSFG